MDCRGKHGSATLACRCALSALVRFSDMQVVSKLGHVKILAFGLAKLARARLSPGSLGNARSGNYIFSSRFSEKKSAPYLGRNHRSFRQIMQAPD